MKPKKKKKKEKKPSEVSDPPLMPFLPNQSIMRTFIRAIAHFGPDSTEKEIFTRFAI